MKHVQLKTIQLKNHPELTERWLQDIIADNPWILGMGDVILKDKERIHQGAGRLDLLLQDAARLSLLRWLGLVEKFLPSNKNIF